MNTLKILLIALLQFILINAASVKYEKRATVLNKTINNIKYELNSTTKTAKIIGFVNSINENISFPSFVDNYIVTTIGQSAFLNNNTIKEVHIPNTIILIEKNAFANCKNLKKVFLSFPKNTRVIETKSFYADDNHLMHVYFTDLNNKYYSTINELKNNLQTTEKRNNYVNEVKKNSVNHYIYFDAFNSNHKRPYIFLNQSNDYEMGNIENQIQHAIYSSPVIDSNTKVDIFVFDFKPITQVIDTYWATANNIRMDETHLKNNGYKIIESPRAYSGFQYGDTIEDKRVIMSFWDMVYNDGQKIHNVTADVVYPNGKGHHYVNIEGSFTQCTYPYSFSHNKWQTVLYRSWNDVVDNKPTTKVGFWIRDENKEQLWTLLVIFDTHVPNSSMLGGPGLLNFFQENPNSRSSDKMREFRIKNIFYRSLGKLGMTQVTNTNLNIYSGDIYLPYVKGKFEFGVIDDTEIFGRTGGFYNNGLSQLENIEKFWNTSCSVKKLRQGFTEKDQIILNSFYYKTRGSQRFYVYATFNAKSSPFFKATVYYKCTNGYSNTQEFIDPSLFDSFAVENNGYNNNKFTINDEKMNSYNLSNVVLSIFDVFDNVMRYTVFEKK
ncbi:hypothetical protein LY90DRAFT_647288 [Neocallimastix californiae]|uniref:Uncharacterized protein n=1 Tax=Neocallimastix californiae TaxID=1754190 RepID=A0A1Y2D4Z8_9FUNG|nr:hypothetical protein LY90DRAFT_647288 [Neocallimastix californiae]|eukprot:ORY54320.1 hypothetical protein LY90DRAFT_647288 [Neocallimastix californiae]